MLLVSILPRGDCVFIAIPLFVDVRLVDAQAGVTQEKCHTGFLHLPSAVPALIFLARRVLVPFPRRP